MENILIGGEPVAVPPEVVSDGRAAVQAWHCAQLAARDIAFSLAENGDPIVSAPDPADATPTAE
jgi:hypothetical protein